MYWLVYQLLLEKEEFDTRTLQNNVSVGICIRKVEAETKEEAIGKFYLDTKSVAFKRRVEPLNCMPFDSLKTI